MKIKSCPEDFVVEEVIKLSLKPRGSYGIYRLRKSGWNTVELVAEIGRMLNKSSSNLDYAGMKDRYALTTQYISIKGGAPEKITGKGFEADRIGYQDRPIGADYLIKNRFQIVVRDLNRHDSAMIVKNLVKVEKFGFPNYFDEQRFGSARHLEGFVAKRLVLCHYAGGLKLYFTPSKWDRSEIKKSKTAVLKHWGDWHVCSQHALPPDKPIFKYLASHPKDFERATNYIERRMMGILVAAYQSFIWNESLKEFLVGEGVRTYSCHYLLGELLFYEELAGQKLNRFRKLRLPVLDHRVSVEDPELWLATEKVLDREGIQQIDLNFRRYPRVRFRSFGRNIIVFPEDLKYGQAEPDEKAAGKWKFTISFALPKGSYATMLLKRLSLDQGEVPGYSRKKEGL